MIWTSTNGTTKRKESFIIKGDWMLNKQCRNMSKHAVIKWNNQDENIVSIMIN